MKMVFRCQVVDDGGEPGEIVIAMKGPQSMVENIVGWLKEMFDAMGKEYEVEVEE